MRYFLLIVAFLTAVFVLRLLTFSLPSFTPGTRVRITTHLAQEPTVKENRQTLRFVNLYATLPRFPEYHYGDKLIITGVVQKGERSLYVENPKITRLEPAGFFANTKLHLTSLISQTLPMPESALVSGIVLGTKQQLPSEFKQSLIKSGTLHVVVASGMNITLLSGMLTSILVFFVKRPIALSLAFAGVWLYIILIGFEPPIIRAAIMGSLAFFAQATGRLAVAWWSLFLSAWTMLMIWPSWINDFGFLLSFSATAGILAFEKPINSLISRRVAPALKQDFSTSLAAQISTTPILFFAFGQFTPWSPIVNALILWTVAPMMVIGFIGGLIGLFIEPLGKFIIFLSYPLVFFFVKVIEIF